MIRGNPIRAILALLCLFLVPGLAAAAQDDGRTQDLARGWRLHQSATDCSLQRTYDGAGSTLLTVMWHRDDGGISFGWNNESWPVANEETGNWVIDFEGVRRVDNLIGRTQRSDDDGSGSVFIPFDSRAVNGLLSDLSSGATIGLYRGDRFIDRLRLDGSDEAVDAMRGCIDRLGGMVPSQDEDGAAPVTPVT